MQPAKQLKNDQQPIDKQLVSVSQMTSLQNNSSLLSQSRLIPNQNFLTKHPSQVVLHTKTNSSARGEARNMSTRQISLNALTSATSSKLLTSGTAHSRMINKIQDRLEKSEKNQLNRHKLVKSSKIGSPQASLQATMVRVSQGVAQTSRNHRVKTPLRQSISNCSFSAAQEKSKQTTKLSSPSKPSSKPSIISSAKPKKSINSHSIQSSSQVNTQAKTNSNSQVKTTIFHSASQEQLMQKIRPSSSQNFYLSDKRIITHPNQAAPDNNNPYQCVLGLSQTQSTTKFVQSARTKAIGTTNKPKQPHSTSSKNQNSNETAKIKKNSFGYMYTQSSNKTSIQAAAGTNELHQQSSSGGNKHQRNSNIIGNQKIKVKKGNNSQKQRKNQQFHLSQKKKEFLEYRDQLNQSPMNDFNITYLPGVQKKHSENAVLLGKSNTILTEEQDDRHIMNQPSFGIPDQLQPDVESFDLRGCPDDILSSNSQARVTHNIDADVNDFLDQSYDSCQGINQHTLRIPKPPNKSNRMKTAELKQQLVTTLENRMEPYDRNGENVLDQTLGQTLTKQKLVLDQIIEHTNKHLGQLDVSQDDETASFVEFQKRFTKGRGHSQPRFDKKENRNSTLMQISTSQILQEGQTPGQVIPSTFENKRGSGSGATGTRSFASRFNSPYHQHQHLVQGVNSKATSLKNPGYIVPNEEGIPSYTNSSIPNNLTSSNNNSQTNTDLQSPLVNHTLESKLFETQGDAFDDADELSGVIMNPVVMHQSNQERSKALQRSKNFTPGGNLFGLKQTKPLAINQTSARESKLIYRRKSREQLDKNRFKPIREQNSGQQMEELNMRLANLNYLQGSIFLAKNYTFLKAIDIRNNRLNDLPGEICTLKHLTHLRIDYNYLQALPFSLGSIRSLQYLSASQNRLIELPDSLFRINSPLQTLLVNDNKIGVLQKSIGILTNLKQLFLHSNLIVEMPTSICQLEKLTDFSLDWFIYIDDQTDTSKQEDTLSTAKKVKANLLGIDSSSGKKAESAGPKTMEKKSNLKNQDDTKVKGMPPANQAGNKKVLKGENGAFLIKEMMLLMMFTDQAYSSIRQGSPRNHKQYMSNPSPLRQTDGSGYLHFIQFVMYFQNLGNINQVKQLTYKHKNRMLIHQLAINGHLYLLKATIAILGISRMQTSLNINTLDEDKSSALILSLKQKRFDFVNYLLRLPHIQTNQYSLKYGLPLHVTLAQCEFKLALRLIKIQSKQHGGEESLEVDINVPNEMGNTAMHIVLHNFQNDEELAQNVAKLLIKKGANLNARNKADLGLLHQAVQQGNIQAVKFAIDHNRAVIRGSHKTRSKHEQQLFDFSAKGGLNEWSVLHFAIYHTNLQMIKLLLDCEENVDLLALDNRGKRAIDLCPYSSPIFKTIRDQLKRRTKNMVLQEIEKPIENADGKGLHGNADENSKEREVKFKLTHKAISTRECIIIPQKRRTIEVMQQLFHLKQQPADHLQQDVPPAPAPFPQKQLQHDQHDYMSNMVTENQPSCTNKSHHYHIKTNSFAPDVLNSQGELHSNRGINTNPFNHLNINGVTGMNGHVSQFGDHEYADYNTNSHNLPSHADNIHNTHPYNATNTMGEYDSNNVIYSSQAAAYPYQLIDEQLNSQLSPTSFENDQMRLEESVAQPRRVLEDMLDLSKVITIQTQMTVLTAESNSDDEEQDDNEISILHRDNSQIQLNACDLTADVGFRKHGKMKNPRELAKTVEQNIRLRSLLETPQLPQSPILSEHGSDGENVINDESELSSKAFEARVSQWNRKLSIKQHSEEKRMHSGKVMLAHSIVEAFEQARKFKARNISNREYDSNEPDRVDDEERPQVASQHQQFSLEPIKMKLLQQSTQINIDEMGNTVQVDQEMDAYIMAHAQVQQRQSIAKVLKNINIADIEDDLSLECPTGQDAHYSELNDDSIGPALFKRNLEEMIIQKKPNQGRNAGMTASVLENLKKAQTRTFNQMSTVKLSELKLKLPLDKIVSPHNDPESKLAAPTGDANVYIVGNDWEVLVWGWKSNTVRIDHAFKAIINFITTNKLKQASKMISEGGSEESPSLQQTKYQLIMNIYELENLILLKNNEIEQKQSMKQLIVINSTGRHRKAPSEFSGAKSFRILTNQKQLINSISTHMMRGKDDHRLNGNHLIVSNAGLDAQSDEQFFSNDNRPNNLFEPFRKKDYNDEDSMIAFDSVPASANLNRQSNRDLISKEISPKHTFKMGHRRNKTATESSKVLSNYLSNQRPKDKRNKAILHKKTNATTFKISQLLEETKGLVNSTSYKHIQEQIKKRESYQTNNSLQQKANCPENSNGAENEEIPTAKMIGSESTEKAKKQMKGVTSGMKMEQPSKKINFDMMESEPYYPRDSFGNGAHRDLTVFVNENTDIAAEYEQGMNTPNRNSIFSGTERKEMAEATAEETEMIEEMFLKPETMTKQGRPSSIKQGIGMHLRQQETTKQFTRASHQSSKTLPKK